VTGSEACTLGGHGGEEVVRLGKEGEEEREEGGGSEQGQLCGTDADRRHHPTNSGGGDRWAPRVRIYGEEKGSPPKLPRGDESRASSFFSPPFKLFNSPCAVV
jgi:hypothetical protein